jgi:hypothetical protein
MTRQHRISITGERDFSVTGAVRIASTRHPIIDAAKALKAAGARDTDTIVANCSSVSVQPVRVAAVLAYKPSEARQATQRSGAGSVHSHFGHQG